LTAENSFLFLAALPWLPKIKFLKRLPTPFFYLSLSQPAVPLALLDAAFCRALPARRAARRHRRCLLPSSATVDCPCLLLPPLCRHRHQALRHPKVILNTLDIGSITNILYLQQSWFPQQAQQQPFVFPQFLLSMSQWGLHAPPPPPQVLQFS
jgi:hypothetical protein